MGHSKRLIVLGKLNKNLEADYFYQPATSLRFMSLFTYVNILWIFYVFISEGFFSLYQMGIWKIFMVQINIFVAGRIRNFTPWKIFFCLFEIPTQQLHNILQIVWIAFTEWQLQVIFHWHKIFFGRPNLKNAVFAASNSFIHAIVSLLIRCCSL